MSVVGAYSGSRKPSRDDYFVANYRNLVMAADRLMPDSGSGAEVVHIVYERCEGRWSEISDPDAYVATAIVRVSREQGGWWKRELRRAQRAAGDAPRVVRGPDAADFERDRRVAAEVARLPRRQRECVVLHHYFDLKQVEIAEILGVHPGTVERHLLRANDKLVRELDEYKFPAREATINPVHQGEV